MIDAFALCCLTLRQHGFSQSETARLLHVTKGMVTAMLRDIDRDTLLAEKTVTAIPAVTLPSRSADSGLRPPDPCAGAGQPKRRLP